MSTISCRAFTIFALILPALIACHGPQGHAAARPTLPTIVAPPGTPRPPFLFSPTDAAFLDEVQRGAFNFLWTVCDPVTGMVYDRTSKPIISVGGVGFQLSAIPIGVEHAWISRAEGEERCERILRSLVSQPHNRKEGLYYHYLDPGTAAPAQAGYERIVSTIDSALLLAGVTTAGSYFGGEVGTLADRIWNEANWPFFVPRDEDVEKPSERGCVSLGWKPTNPDHPTGHGKLLPYYWVDSGDEHRLVTFLGVCAPIESHRLPPHMYYRLRRAIGRDDGGEPFVWFPWAGALFTAFFAHCWIDYADQNADDPAAFGVDCRTRVDWWENSRRIVAMHRRKAIANPNHLPTFAEHAWGLSACDAASGYIVPGLFPKLEPMPGCTPEIDFSAHQPSDDFGDGTLAPYAAGSSILFEPQASLNAMKHYRNQTRADGTPLVWRAPAAGGFGFQDSFNAGTGWVAPDCVAIDQGPLIVLIENARTGNVWNWVNASENVKAGRARLRFR